MSQSGGEEGWRDGEEEVKEFSHSLSRCRQQGLEEGEELMHGLNGAKWDEGARRVP